MTKDRYDRLDEAIAAGNVCRGVWFDDADRCCPLGTLVPECVEARSANSCPRDVLPAWFARFTPWWADHCSAGMFDAFLHRWAAIVRAWPHAIGVLVGERMLTDGYPRPRDRAELAEAGGWWDAVTDARTDAVFAALEKELGLEPRS